MNQNSNVVEWNNQPDIPQQKENEQARELKIIRGDFVKPAITFHQKISLFTLRVKFLRPYNGKTSLTGHSFLLEMDYEKRTIEHELCYLSLKNLVYRTYSNNVNKAILVDNVTNTIIWTYYGRLDKYPEKINFITTPEGDKLMNDYEYYDWSERKYKRVNIMRDNFNSLQEKINLNMEWHKAEWRKKAMQQAKREMAAMEKPTGKGAVENHNVSRLTTSIDAKRKEVFQGAQVSNDLRDLTTEQLSELSKKFTQGK